MTNFIQFQTQAATERGYLALPAAGRGPGVLVLHAWWGLTPIFTDFCDRLAAEGFVAFAPDLHAGQIATTIAEAELLVSGDNPRREASVFAGLEYLQNHEAVTGKAQAVIGFSMGAAWALVLSAAKPEDVAAVVLFYGAYPVDFRAAQARYLGHFSDQDDWEPLDGVRQMEADMRAAGRDVTMHIYPGMQHWFFEQNRPEYNAAAAELAWKRTLAFLHDRTYAEQK